MKLNEDQRSYFNEQGYVILKDIFSREDVRAVRDDLGALVEKEAQKLLAAGKIVDPLKDKPFETRLYLLYQNHLEAAPKSIRRELHLEATYRFFFNQKLLDVVESILGSEIRLYPNYTCRPKFPEHDQHRVNWHQDGGYTADLKQTALPMDTVDSLSMVNVWSPLVPARVENGCMQFIPGSHRLGLVPHLQKEHYLEIDEKVLLPLLPKAANIELDPGDVVLFNNLIFHQGLPNRSSSIRRTLDWRYQDARQPTLRKLDGHLARSQKSPSRVIPNAAFWASFPQEAF